jgi:hypothetical protein
MHVQLFLVFGRCEPKHSNTRLLAVLMSTRIVLFSGPIVTRTSHLIFFSSVQAAYTLRALRAFSYCAQCDSMSSLAMCRSPFGRLAVQRPLRNVIIWDRLVAQGLIILPIDTTLSIKECSVCPRRAAGYTAAEC